MLMILSLFSILLLTHSIAADTITITVNKYTGLKRREIRGIENQFYQFQFCACPKNLVDQLVANNIEECDCSNFEKGKQLRDSIGTAKLSDSVISKISNYEEEKKRLFVKILVGDRVLTAPDFQSLPMSNSKSEVILKTLPNSKMRLTYTAKSTSDDTSNSVMTDEKKPTPSKFSSFFKNLKNVVVKKEHQEVTSSRGSVQIDPEIRRLSNINMVKSFLFARSRIDQNEPSRYDIQGLKNMIVTYHNIYRSKHSAPALSVDPVLESRGKRWADELAYHKGCLVHEQPRVYGENLFFFGARNLPSPKTLAQTIVQSFHLEGNGYNYSGWKPFSYFKTGHFTQLVWKNSSKIGVGVSIVKANTVRSQCISTSSSNMYLIFVVVKYDPAGNYETRDAYMENVQRPNSSF